MGPKTHSFSFVPASLILLVVLCSTAGIGWCTCPTSFVFHGRHTWFRLVRCLGPNALDRSWCGCRFSSTPSNPLSYEDCAAHRSDGMEPKMDGPSENETTERRTDRSFSNPIDPKMLGFAPSIYHGWFHRRSTSAWMGATVRLPGFRMDRPWSNEDEKDGIRPQ